MLNVIVRLVVIEKNYDFNNTTDSDMDINRLAIALLYGNEKVEVVEIDQSNKQIKLRFFGSESKLDRIVKKTVNNTKQNIIGNKKTQIYEHSSKGRKDNISSWNELIRLGYVHEFDKGHCGYTGFFLEVVKELDSLFVQIAKRMNASEVCLPNLIPCNLLNKLGLIDEYPHFLYFATPLEQKKNKVANFQKKFKTRTFSLKSHLTEPKFFLKTSACSLLYPLLENVKLNSSKYYTILGHCTRNELGVQTFERMSEFNMREIVYIGDEKGVEKFQQISLNLFEDILTEFDLTGDISVANDSFFITNYDKLKLAQMLGCNKYEVNINIPETNKNIAAASFNNHRNFFSKRFHFNIKDEDTVSACVGFGLERLAYGIISQHGINKEKIMLMINKLKCKY